MPSWLSAVLGGAITVALAIAVFTSERMLDRRARARMNRDRNALLAHLRRVRAATSAQLSANTGLPVSRVLHVLRWMEREQIVEGLDRHNETFAAIYGGRPRRYYRIRRDAPLVDSVSGVGY